ncbi:MAG: sensor histidine kinase [Betaproteobacteria bacterium]|nr:sensor histidine kinase [Betaproteobacteria bacterium]
MQAPSPAVPASSPLASAAWSLSQRHWRFVVIAMLALLHVAVLRGTADNWARALLLAHLGLLLLWQPFLRGEQRISLTQGAFIALGAVAVMLWLSWWLLAFWVVVLAGLVGGKVFLHQARWQRRSYLLVLIYLLALLAIIILPEIAPRREVAPEIRTLAEYGLPLLLVALALMPAEPDAPEAPQVIDFFYSIFLMLVLGMVILGSFTFMTLGRIAYLEALTNTVFLIAGSIFVLGLAWNPRTGYAGLNVFFSRYLFSIGLPVEKWLFFLAELSQLEARPERFLAEGVAGLARLPWIAGAAWEAAGQHGETGERSDHAVLYESRDLELTIFSRYRTSPALQWHMHLLGQLLGEFYAAKLREQKLREASYLQAVHETGARLTHDVKNLLQSLNVLCSVAAQDDTPGLQALMRRQLPAITQRLQATLEKLQRPGDEEPQQVALREWWEALGRQYQAQGVEFSAAGLDPELRVPKALFDSVADNLLQNALAKRAAGQAIGIRATILCGKDGPELRVRDSGKAVPAEVAGGLLRAPVRSGEGLGIGLYQAARHAETSGYALRLAENRDGAVCFALSRVPA